MSLILVDTSIWIDHLRTGRVTLAELLQTGQVRCHPWVVGEVGLGTLSRRAEILSLLSSLPQATVATHDEVMILIEHHQLYGVGIGYVDAQLLAATRLTPATQLWTNDRALEAAAERLGLATNL